MNKIKVFENPEFGSIRIVEEGEKYLFCGTDVARALGYKDTPKALKLHCLSDGWAFCPVIDKKGRTQNTRFISEGNLYRLIVHSKLPTAERFERWVFDEVLPSIRKHGAYLTQEKLWEVATSPEALMKLCTDLIGERNKNAELTAINEQLTEKASYFDAFVEAGQCTNLRITAKELAVPERKFVRFLLQHGYVYRTHSGNVLPYAKRENNGLFCVKDYRNNDHLGTCMLVTPAGKQHFYQMRDLILLTI